MKHYFLTEGSLTKELLKALEKNGRLIIAYDFDNTIHPSGKITREGAQEIIDLLNKWRDHATFLCYTANVDIMKVYKYIISNNVPCDAVNENPLVTLNLYGHYGYSKETKKPYANIYLDDKAGLREAFFALEEVWETVFGADSGFNG